MVYAWALPYIPSDRREEWERDLAAPLVGAEKAKPTEYQVEQEGADFMAAMMQFQGG